MTDFDEQAQEVAQRLDTHLPPHSKRVTLSDDPLVQVAQKIAQTPIPALSPQAKARITEKFYANLATSGTLPQATPPAKPLLTPLNAVLAVTSFIAVAGVSLLFWRGVTLQPVIAPTATPTVTLTYTATPTLTHTATYTPTSTATPTVTLTYTATPTLTHTTTYTPTPTATPTLTSTNAPMPSPTNPPLVFPTNTPLPPTEAQGETSGCTLPGNACNAPGIVNQANEGNPTFTGNSQNGTNPPSNGNPNPPANENANPPANSGNNGNAPENPPGDKGKGGK